jgi:hypothetical protein
MSARRRRVGDLDGAYHEASLVRPRHKAPGLGAQVKTGFKTGEEPLQNGSARKLVPAQLSLQNRARKFIRIDYIARRVEDYSSAPNPLQRRE